jgi:uncharacterized protein YsxB (DUF464 family)
MITVRLLRTPSGFLRRIAATGHAGYAKKENEDIICAAVSAIVQTAVGGLQDVAGFEPAYSLENGRIACGVPDPESLDPGTYEIIRVIMETTAVGLKQIELSYGSRYVNVQEAAYTEKGGAAS